MSQSTSTLPAVKFFVSAAMLATAIKRALPCIDKSSARYSMYCLWFAVTEGKLNVQATDGRRLVSQDIPATGTIPGSFLLDYKDAKSLAALARKAGRKGEVGMELNGDKVSACNQTERAEWYDVAGRFPRTGDVLAHQYETTTGLNIGDFAELVSEAVVHTTDDNRGLTLTLCPSIGPGSSPMMIVQVTRGNETLYRRCLSCPVNGPGGYAVLDAEWLAAMVKTLDGKAHLHVALNDHKSQLRFMQDGFTFIIMPIADDAQPIKASKPKRARKPRAKVAAMAPAPVAVEEVAPLKPVAETTPIETHIGDDRHDSYRTFCNLGMPELATIGGRFVPFMVADSLIAGTTGFPYPPTCPSCREQYLARLEAMFPEPSPDATDPDIILDPDATVLDIPVSDEDQVIPHGWDAIEADELADMIELEIGRLGAGCHDLGGHMGIRIETQPSPHECWVRAWDHQHNQRFGLACDVHAALEATKGTESADEPRGWSSAWEALSRFPRTLPCRPGPDSPSGATPPVAPLPGFSEPVAEKDSSVPQGRSSADDDDSYRKAREIIEARRYGAEMHAVEGVIWNVVSSIMENVQAEPNERGKVAWGKLADRSFEAMTGQEREDFEAWLAFIGYRPGAWYSPASTADRWEAFILECLTGTEIITNPSPEPDGDDDGTDQGRSDSSPDYCDSEGQGGRIGASQFGRHADSSAMARGPGFLAPIGADYHHPRFLVSRFNGGFSLVPNPLAGLSHDHSTSFHRTGSVRDLECRAGADSQESRDLDRVAGALADPGVAGHPLPVARDGAGAAAAPGLDGHAEAADTLNTENANADLPAEDREPAGPGPIGGGGVGRLLESLDRLSGLGGAVDRAGHRPLGRVVAHPEALRRDGAATPGLDTLTILVHGLGQPCHSADTACTGADHDIDAGIRSEGLGIRSEGRPGGQHGVGPANGALEANPRVDPDGRAQPISRSDHRSSQTVALTIGGRPYSVTSGPGWLDLEKSSGESYRVTLEGSQGPSCDCHDYRYRRAGLDSLGCKHLRALRAEGLLPRPTPAYDLMEF